MFEILCQFLADVGFAAGRWSADDNEFLFHRRDKGSPFFTKKLYFIDKNSKKFPPCKI